MPIARLFPALFCLKLRHEQTSVVNILKPRMLWKGKSQAISGGGGLGRFLRLFGIFFSNGKSQIFIIFSAGWLDFI